MLSDSPFPTSWNDALRDVAKTLNDFEVDLQIFPFRS